jgi:phenylalanyl-tRNA synthetase beta chain
MSKSQPDEPRFVCGVMSGAWDDDQWNQKYPKLNFFDAKGVVQQLLKALRITKVRFKVADPQSTGGSSRAALPRSTPTAESSSAGSATSTLRSLKELRRRADVVAFELSVEALLRLAKRELPYVEVPTLPGVDCRPCHRRRRVSRQRPLEQRIKSLPAASSSAGRAPLRRLPR